MIGVLLITAMLVTGCLSVDDDDDDEKVKPGDLVTQDEDMEVGTADEVDVYLEQGSGSMEVSSGASKLMEATFKYNIDKWEPEITYKEVGGTWNLSVIQPETDLHVATGARNEWDVSLSNDVPIDLVVNLGAGDADIEIGDLDLTDLDVNLGAGDLNLHLGTYDGDNLTVAVNCGAGDARLTVSDEMGVRVVPILGVGTVKGTGFTLVGTEYHNSVYDPAQPHIVIYANLGVGDLTLVET